MSLAAKVIDQWADPIWRLNNVYYIQDKNGDKVRFQLNDTQADLFSNLWYRNLVLKSRQRGITTAICLLMLDECVFNDNISCGIIAHTREDAETIFKTKVKFCYDELPEGVRNQNPATISSVRELEFANKSVIRVGTSLRSGTYQKVLVSEYGKICSKYPEKAKEVKSGTLNTVAVDQMAFIESTAEGQEGDFFAMSEAAKEKDRAGTPLTKLDYKFHFYPWHTDPDCTLMPHGVVITAEMQEYFDTLKAEHGIELTDEQKAWYVKKRDEQGDDMFKEYPSTPEEAFKVSIEGAYYATQMKKIDEENRVGEVPHRPDLPVETWWDLGMNDLMFIWFIQRVGAEVHAIDCYHNSGEGLAHYANILTDKQKERNLIYSRHLWPHDGNVRIMDEHGRHRTEVMRALGYEPFVVQRGLLPEGREKTRNMLARTRFDAQRCDYGIKSLRGYRKRWNDTLGNWSKEPLPNNWIHGADAFRTGAMYTEISLGGPIKYPRMSIHG